MTTGVPGAPLDVHSGMCARAPGRGPTRGSYLSSVSASAYVDEDKVGVECTRDAQSALWVQIHRGLVHMCIQVAVDTGCIPIYVRVRSA